MPTPARRIEKTGSFRARDESGNDCWVDEFAEIQLANSHESATGQMFYALRTGERLYRRSRTDFETGSSRRITRIDG